MQKNKLNLRICGIHLLNPYKTVVSHLKRPSGTFDISRASGCYANRASSLNSVATVKRMFFLCELLELLVVAIIISSLAIIVVQRSLIYFGKNL